MTCIWSVLFVASILVLPSEADMNYPLFQKHDDPQKLITVGISVLGTDRPDEAEAQDYVPKLLQPTCL